MLAVLALVAIAVRVAVPSGYMAAPTDDGRFLTIVLCSGHEAVLDLDERRLLDTKDGLGDTDTLDVSPCVFASFVSFSTPEILAELPHPRLSTVANPYAKRDVNPGRGLAAPPPWPTGPPIIS